MFWHEKVLDKSGFNAARRLASLAGGNFYLAGGTGLALRLGHRISLDLDLFSTDCLLDHSDRLALKKSLETSGKVEIMEEKDGTCHLRLENTAVSLFHYPYKLLKPPSKWSGLKIASVEDIAAMKLSAIISRGAKKDFIDLFFICRSHKPAGFFKWAERKFPGHPNFAVQAAKALVYFEDAEKEPMPRMLIPVRWSAIKAFFEKESIRSLVDHC
ncbi:MAG: nucleotidyl transferase AbiEii/AbiGii toxin family protein [Elusimicrobia bacterium]|nr:nucleotidyl transferase AbiEii/AbiGii toxin family protein [Elusimicrobiota bacterium]